MPRTCVYPGCRTDSNSAGRSLFSFPVRDATRLQSWLQIIGCSGDQAFIRNRGVCDLHFDPKFLSSNPRRKILLGVAMPNPPPEEHENEEPEEPAEEQQEYNADADDSFAYIEYEDQDDDADIANGDDDATFQDFEDPIAGITDEYAHSEEPGEATPVKLIPIQVRPESSTSPVSPVSKSTSSAIRVDVVSSPTLSEVLNSLAKPSTTENYSINLRAIQSLQYEAPDRRLSQVSEAGDERPVKKRPRVEEDAAKEDEGEDDPDSTPSIPVVIASSPNGRQPPPKLVTVRGVEHVMMPLYVYEAEQKMMRDELLYWKNIVLGFKQTLDDVEF